SALQFVHAAKQLGGKARVLLDQIVLHIGIAIANLICAYDPSLVVLQGDLLCALMDDLQTVVTRAVPWETRMALSEITGDAVLLGAVVAARTHAYDRIARLFNEQASGVQPVSPTYATV